MDGSLSDDTGQSHHHLSRSFCLGAGNARKKLRAFSVPTGIRIRLRNSLVSIARAQETPAFFLRAFSVPTGIRSYAA